MKSKLENLLRGEGYKKLHTDALAITVYFMPQPGCVTAVMLCDMSLLPGAGGEYYKEQLQRLKWRFYDAGTESVNILTLLLTRDVEEGILMASDDRFCWLVDLPSQRLVIPKEKVENFYGLRDGLQMAVAAPEYEAGYLEEPLEYEANGKRSYRHIGQRPVVNHTLLILNLIGYLLCILFVEALYDWGDLRWQQVLAGEWYRVFTSMFIHGDAGHLTGNMLILLVIGDIAERAMGHIRYAVLYILGGITAAAVSMSVSFMKGSLIGSIGASGAIFAVTGALLWILLRNKGKLESLTTKKIFFLIAYTLYFGLTSTGIDNAAHIGGLAGGFLLAVFLYSKKKGRGKG